MIEEKVSSFFTAYTAVQINDNMNQLIKFAGHAEIDIQKKKELIHFLYSLKDHISDSKDSNSSV